MAGANDAARHRRLTPDPEPMRSLAHPRPSRRSTRVVAASHAGVDLAIGAVAGLLPSIRADLDLTRGEVAVVVTVLAAVSSFGQPVAGRLIDRSGPRWPAIAGAAATVIFLATMPILPSYAAVVTASVLGGLGAAVYHPAAATLTRQAVNGQRPASALGLFAAGGTVGLATGPLLATWAAGPLLPVFLALPGILLAGVLAATTTSLEHERSRGAEESAGAPGVRESLRRTLPLVVAMSGVYLTAITFSTAVPLWLAETGRPGVIGSTLAVFSLAAATGGLVGGRLISVTGNAAHAVYPMVLAPIALLAIAATAPGTTAWFATVAMGGTLGSTAIPVALDAAQSKLAGSIASASGLLMGLPIGLASLGYLGLSAAVEQLEVGAVVSIAAGATTVAALLLWHALTPANQLPRSRRLPACPCTSGGLAIAAC